MAKKKFLATGNGGLAREKGFVHTLPLETNEHLSIMDEVRKTLAIFKRQEKIILWVYISVFLVGLFIAEAIQPNLVRNFILSFTLGLSAGILAAVIYENMDDRIGNSYALREILPLPLLGVAPPAPRREKHSYALLTAKKPNSRVARAFHSLRHNILSNLEQQQVQVINITSTDASEGKSSTSINLATSLADAGKKVLLIDADLRRPTLHKYFELDNTKGFGTYLTGISTLADISHATDISGLYVAPAGPITPHPVELLSGEHMEALPQLAASEDYDFDVILIDSPPVMGMADALLISNRVDATLLVVAGNQTGETALQNTFARLHQAKTNLMGMVMTKTEN